MSAQYYSNSGAYHPGTNVTHAPAEAYAPDGEYAPHGSDGYGSVPSDPYDTGSESYVTAGADQYPTPNSGVQYGYTGQPGQPVQPGQSPQQGQPGQPAHAPQFSFENPVWRFWVSSEGISRRVIQENITAFLGADARVKIGPGVGDDAGKPGFWISAYRDLTPTMKDDLKKFTLQAERGGIQGQPGGRYERPQPSSRKNNTPPQPAGSGYPPPRGGRGHDPRVHDPYGRQPNSHGFTQPGYQPQDPYYPTQHPGHSQPIGEPYLQYPQPNVPHSSQRPQPPPPGNFGMHQPPMQNQYPYPNQGGARPPYQGDYAQQAAAQQQDGYYNNPNTTPPPTSANIPPGYYMGTDGKLWPQTYSR